MMINLIMALLHSFVAILQSHPTVLLGVSFLPIGVRRVQGANAAFPFEDRYPESATQTFNIGVPVTFSAGFIVEAATQNSGTTTFLGFSTEPASNLTTSGVAKTLTYGKVQNQTSAVLIPVGAPPNDGTIGVVIAKQGVDFIGILYDSTPQNHTIAAADLDAIYGLTKDATSGFWYVDANITTVAGGACVRITELVDPIGTVNGRVAFVVENIRQAQLN
jgi:hypothetical protein